MVASVRPDGRKWITLIGAIRISVIPGLALFIVVTNNFLDCARAIRHKLILEIAGAVLVKWNRKRVRFVKAERIPIPCDADENRLEDDIDSW